MHPTVLNFGGFSVHWYGVMVALGFLIGLWLASRRALQGGIAPEKILDLGPWLILGGIVGARFFYVVSYWQKDFAGQPIWEIFMVQHGGLVFYGGLFGATFAGMFYARVKKISVWQLGDILAPSLALGYAIGRIGCLLNGCCYGRVCSLPWAISFPIGHETHPVGLPATPIHPTQIYDSLLNLGFYFALAWLYRRNKSDGHVFAIYLMGYALLRSFVELFRGDYSTEHLYRGLTPAHLVSIAIFAGGLILFLNLPRKQPPPA